MTFGLVQVGAVPARADTVPFEPISTVGLMRGSLDSLVFVPEEGVVATGWSFYSQEPTKVTPPDSGSWQVLRPDGKATWWSSISNQVGLSRPDVAAAYPQAGPNHGFRMNLGYPGEAGTYRFCARTYAEVIGCRSVQVDAETLSGVSESLTLESAGGAPALRIRGWVADTWATTSNRMSFNVSSMNTDSGYSDSWVYPGSASLDRPDVRAARPGLQGVKGFDVTIPIYGPGDYTVCPWIQPEYAYPGNAPAATGCLSITVAGMKQVTESALTGTATPGSTLSFTPATWNPAPTVNRVRWWSSDRDAAIEGVLDYPVALSDVGHTISVVQDASAPGTLPGRAGRSSAVVTLPGVDTSRLAGADRYAVAVANSQAQFTDAAVGARVVYVAAGEKFADALSAGPAAAVGGAALLLTPTDRLLAPVRAEIARLHPTSIVVVGGPASVGAPVMRELEKIAPTIRLGGADRYEVSRAVMAHAFPDGAQTAFVVTGSTYPDALSAGAAAGSVGAPVLLTHGSASSADAATRSALASLGARAVTVVGGEASVSAGVAGSLGAGIAVTRYAGADRYAAAVALNRGSFTSADTVYLATGRTFPDGLTIGARAGLQHAPLYLVTGECVSLDVLTDIVALGASEVVILGGTSSVSAAVDSLYVCA
ncbi:cell wall-binding repeat-containing protein [Herbiconiux liukaitaii]|uniref:cell wall-binding repeat-containing protein n=1 Tax=Herbiconiux liukaitaii TaxID=3342799 RepID=UPI0035BB1B8F